MLAMRRESDPIYGSVSATTNLNLLHHHAHHHTHHHSHHHHSPAGHSHPSNGAAVTETSPGGRASENGTQGGSSAIGGVTDHTGQGAYHGHPLAQPQLQQDHQQTLPLHHHHHGHRAALSPATTASFGHGGFATLCNGTSANGLYPGFNSFGLNPPSGSSGTVGRSTHPAASSLDEYVDILQVQQLLLENSSSAATTASSSTVASITTASCTSTTSTTTTVTSSSSSSTHIPTVSTASFFSPASIPSSSSSSSSLTSSTAHNAKNRPKVNLQKAAEFSAANQLQDSHESFGTGHSKSELGQHGWPKPTHNPAHTHIRIHKCIISTVTLNQYRSAPSAARVCTIAMQP
uniref:Uncharacterized protein n=1 Tax=Anopheles culicifacies TaxID=139723 RepID=A0A182MAL9_9DIPT